MVFPPKSLFPFQGNFPQVGRKIGTSQVLNTMHPFPSSLISSWVTPFPDTFPPLCFSSCHPIPFSNLWCLSLPFHPQTSQYFPSSRLICFVISSKKSFPVPKQVVFFPSFRFPRLMSWEQLPISLLQLTPEYCP